MLHAGNTEEESGCFPSAAEWRGVIQKGRVEVQDKADWSQWGWAHCSTLTPAGTRDSWTETTVVAASVSILKHCTVLWEQGRLGGVSLGKQSALPLGAFTVPFPPAVDLGRQHMLGCNFRWFEIWHLQVSCVASVRGKTTTTTRKQGSSLKLE